MGPHVVLLGDDFEDEVLVENVDLELVIGDAVTEEEKDFDVLDIPDVEDMFAVPDKGDEEVDDEEEDQDGEGDENAAVERESVGLPSILPQITCIYKYMKVHTIYTNTYKYIQIRQFIMKTKFRYM